MSPAGLLQPPARADRRRGLLGAELVAVRPGEVEIRVMCWVKVYWVIIELSLGLTELLLRETFAIKLAHI